MIVYVIISREKMVYLVVK